MYSYGFELTVNTSSLFVVTGRTTKETVDYEEAAETERGEW